MTVAAPERGVALVTGAGSGIGLAVAKRLGLRGRARAGPLPAPALADRPSLSSNSSMGLAVKCRRPSVPEAARLRLHYRPEWLTDP